MIFPAGKPIFSIYCRFFRNKNDNWQIIFQQFANQLQLLLCGCRSRRCRRSFHPDFFQIQTR